MTGKPVQAPGADPAYVDRAYGPKLGVDGRLHPWWCMAVPCVGVKVGPCDCKQSRGAVS